MCDVFFIYMNLWVYRIMRIFFQWSCAPPVPFIPRKKTPQTVFGYPNVPMIPPIDKNPFYHSTSMSGQLDESNFFGARLHVRTPTDILTEIWSKFLLNLRILNCIYHHCKPGQGSG